MTKHLVCRLLQMSECRTCPYAACT